MAYGKNNIEPEEYAMLEQEALDVRATYGLFDNFIDIFDFVTNILGAKLVKYSSFSEDKRSKLCDYCDRGFTLFQDYGDGYLRPTIYYNDDLPLGNQRYTLAHETRHIIHQETNPSSKDEAYAEYFAKVFLAPKFMVIQCNTDSEETIECEFGLSKEAAKYTLISIKKRLDVYKKTLFPFEKEFLKLKYL